MGIDCIWAQWFAVHVVAGVPLRMGTAMVLQIGAFWNYLQMQRESAVYQAQATYKSDPRASCAIVAKSVLDELQAREQAPSAKVFARTLLRLLDSYRFGFTRDEPSEGVLQFTPLSPSIEMYERQDEKVRSAIERAHVATFPDQSAGDVVAELSQAVRHYFGLRNANLEGVRDVIPVERLRDFLDRLKEQLSPSA